MYQDHVARDEREGKRIETGTNCKIDDQGISATHLHLYKCNTSGNVCGEDREIRNT